jgi:hypothetical protein
VVHAAGLQKCGKSAGFPAAFTFSSADDVARGYEENVALFLITTRHQEKPHSVSPFPCAKKAPLFNETLLFYQAKTV